MPFIRCVTFFSSIAVLVFVLSVRADDKWSVVDDFVENKTLCEAFAPGTFVFSRKECSFGCNEWEYRIEVKCSTEDGATLDYWNGDDNFAINNISVAQWQEIKGNLLRQKARGVESFGNSFAIIEVIKHEESLEARYEIKNGGRTLIENGLWILRKGHALAQMSVKNENILRPWRETRSEILKSHHK